MIFKSCFYNILIIYLSKSKKIACKYNILSLLFNYYYTHIYCIISIFLVVLLLTTTTYSSMRIFQHYTVLI